MPSLLQGTNFIRLLDVPKLLNTLHGNIPFIRLLDLPKLVKCTTWNYSFYQVISLHPGIVFTELALEEQPRKKKHFVCVAFKMISIIVLSNVMVVP